MRAVIIHESDQQDLKVVIRRKGRRIIIVTDAPHIARAVKRQIVESMKGDDGDMVVKGFS